MNKNTIRKKIDGKLIYQITMNGKKYQQCCICEEYFELSGYNQKYCTECGKKENIKKTSERNKERYHASKVNEN